MINIMKKKTKSKKFKFLWNSISFKSKTRGEMTKKKRNKKTNKTNKTEGQNKFRMTKELQE